jgi:hypothetical protein
MPDLFTLAHRAPIILAAARNNVPAVYSLSLFARDGGLLSYGTDPVDIDRRAASYVDRVLRDEKPGDLPVQFPTKFEMVVNRRTATALGLAIPPSILLRADDDRIDRRTAMHGPSGGGRQPRRGQGGVPGGGGRRPSTVRPAESRPASAFLGKSRREMLGLSLSVDDPSLP